MHSIWKKLSDLITQTGAQLFTTVIEQIRTVFSGDPETRRQVAFSVSMIALSAKMAKADGIVTDAETRAFYEIFSVPVEEARHVERLYNLAKQDVAGFDYYARRLFKLCRDSDCDGLLLEDVLDGLFHIAKADGALHENELLFLQNVSSVFQFSKARFEAVAMRHMTGRKNPWAVLGLTPDVSYQQAKKRYHALVREHHPDHVIARGLPKEFITIANERLAAINEAWAYIREELSVPC